MLVESGHIEKTGNGEGESDESKDVEDQDGNDKCHVWNGAATSKRMSVHYHGIGSFSHRVRH